MRNVETRALVLAVRMPNVPWLITTRYVHVYQGMKVTL